LTNRRDWADRARHLSTQAKSDPIEYVHDEVGYNYRLTNVLAAIGVAQLEQLDDRVMARRRVASAYSAALGDQPGVTGMTEAPWAFSTFWLYTVRVDADVYGMDSRAVLRKLADANVQARPLWEPLHRSVAHQHAYACEAPVSDAWYRDALSLPSSAALTTDQQRRVIDVIRRT
jgi:perosamine synthetase